MDILILNVKKLALSTFFGVSFASIIKDLIELTPDRIFGITLILWILYGFTILLDWKVGIKAAKLIAIKNNQEFEFDRTKASVSFYKNALFIIVMATIYSFQKEAIYYKFNESVKTILIIIQMAYFAYNMLEEWLSIETNKYKITNKKTRLYNFLYKLLDIVDTKTLEKIKKLF